MEKRDKLPKNICQMGERDAWMRVYLEDDVNVYMKKQAAKEMYGAGVFLGEKKVVEGEMCLFVQGAFVLEGAVASDGTFQITDHLRTSMEEKAAACFSGMQIVGWYVSEDMGEALDLYQSQKMKRQLFPVGETLFCINALQERQFFSMTEEMCRPLLGYYIYYAANRNMQEYMSVTSSVQREEANEKAVPQRRNSGHLAYGLCAGLTLVLAVSGTFILQKKAMWEKPAEKAQAGVIIQVVEGGIEPTLEESETETLPNP